MTYTYKPKGTCSRQIEIDIENNIVTKVDFIGGCNGNGKGIGALVEGMSTDEIIKKLEGITCGMRSTSCPDQLAKALKELK